MCFNTAAGKTFSARIITMSLCLRIDGVLNLFYYSLPAVAHTPDCLPEGRYFEKKQQSTARLIVSVPTFISSAQQLCHYLIPKLEQ